MTPEDIREAFTHLDSGERLSTDTLLCEIACQLAEANRIRAEGMKPKQEMTHDWAMNAAGFNPDKPAPPQSTLARDLAEALEEVRERGVAGDYCWCDDDWHERHGKYNHGPYCIKARAALARYWAEKGEK